MGGGGGGWGVGGGGDVLKGLNVNLLRGKLDKEVARPDLPHNTTEDVVPKSRLSSTTGCHPRL